MSVTQCKMSFAPQKMSAAPPEMLAALHEMLATIHLMFAKDQRAGLRWPQGQGGPPTTIHEKSLYWQWKF